MNVQRVAELTIRESYGRLVAYLASRWGDVMAAEDALSEAFLAALEQWPQAGVPQQPEAWLLVVARRRLIDLARRGKVREDAMETFKQAANLAQSEGLSSAPTFPDERLQLLFTCAHPAIDRGVRTALMLQTVLGLNAETIGSAFLVAPTTMGQRLVRAKAKIRDAGIRFELPEGADLRPRLEAVLEAIYAAYSTGWDDVAGADPRSKGLAEEAIWLGRLVGQLLPEEAEAKGLLALMLHCEARRPARLDAAGQYVPLSDQQVELWSHTLFDEAERLLIEAATLKQPGRFQLEAAIQSAHSHGVSTGQPDWQTIALLYEGLVQQFPTIGALVSRAAALAQAKGTEAGLAALAAFPSKPIKTSQPYWALKAHLLKEAGELAAAREAYQLAIGLTEAAAVRDFLQRQAP